MADLTSANGKTIKEIKESSDGKNSFIIIQFSEGGKLNITSNTNSNKGVAQLDIDTGKISLEDAANKRIHSVIEEFDGVNDSIIITLKDGNKLTITAFSSIEDDTATINTHIYGNESVIVESMMKLYQIFENEYSDGRNGNYPLSKPQYENGIDSARVQDFTEFWSIYSGLYEDLMLPIEDLDELDQVYQDGLQDPEMDTKSKKALIFFYNIRKKELNDPNFWESVLGKREVSENKNTPMKAKLVKESLNEYGSYGGNSLELNSYIFVLFERAFGGIGISELLKPYTLTILETNEGIDHQNPEVLKTAIKYWEEEDVQIQVGEESDNGATLYRVEPAIIIAALTAVCEANNFHDYSEYNAKHWTNIYEYFCGSLSTLMDNREDDRIEYYIEIYDGSYDD